MVRRSDDPIVDEGDSGLYSVATGREVCVGRCNADVGNIAGSIDLDRIDIGNWLFGRWIASLHEISGRLNLPMVRQDRTQFARVAAQLEKMAWLPDRSAKLGKTLGRPGEHPATRFDVAFCIDSVTALVRHRRR